MRLIRSVQRTALLLGLLTAACVDGQFRKRFFGMTPGPTGAVWVHGWCRRIVRSLRIGCDVEGPLPEAGGSGLAVVSNHLSYLDILLYASLRPFTMVAKSEVRSWPLIGWITAQAGTIYVERSNFQGTRIQTHAEVNAAMASAFRGGLPVLFYPEGTTTDGTHVLPFRRGLFNSIVYDEIAVQTAAIAYQLAGTNTVATVDQHVCYWGDMVFAPHLFECLGLKGVRARIRFSPGTLTGLCRFGFATQAHAEVERAYERLNGPAGSPGTSFPQAAPEPITSYVLKQDLR